MLKALAPMLVCPTCLKLDGIFDAPRFYRGSICESHIRQNGVLICEDCHAWYPIEDDLLELMETSLLDLKISSTSKLGSSTRFKT